MSDIEADKEGLPQLYRGLTLIETFKEVFGGKPPELTMTTEQHEGYLQELKLLPEKFKTVATSTTLCCVPIKVIKSGDSDE